MKRNSTIKWIVSAALCLALCFGLLSMTAFAEDTVNYVEYTWNETTGLESQTKSVTEYTEVTSETTTWSNGGWYVVKGNVTIDSRVTVNGSANLILTDGCVLDTKGITVNSGNTLIVYGQSQGDGKLSAVAKDDIHVAGIGGGDTYESCGTVVIHGGIVNAIGARRGAGIGGAGNASDGSRAAGHGGTVTIYNGTVTAEGSYDSWDLYSLAAGAGIGGGGGYSNTWVKSGAGGTVNIYGGIVNAIGGKTSRNYRGSGIGGGGCWEINKNSKLGGKGGNVTIAGGIVNAIGHSDGIGSGYDVRGVEDVEQHNGSRSFSNCIVNGTVYGSFTLTEDYTIPSDKTFTVPDDAELTIDNGVTLTVEGALVNNGRIINNGTLNLQTKDKLSGAGTVTGTGTKQILNITPDQIIVPTDLVYNGEDQTQAAQNVIDRSLGQEGETICGASFTYVCRFDSISPAEVKNAGTYTVSYKNDRNETVTRTFSVAPKDITGAMASAFAEMTYTGSGQTPVAAVTINDLPVTGSWSEVTNVTDTTTFTANGNFTGSIGAYPTGMQPKSVTAVVTVKDKYWDGTNAAEVTVTADTGIEGEDIIISGVTATFVDGDIGEIKAVTLNQESMEITYPNNRTDNYHVTVAGTATADIKAIPLTISGVVMDADAYTYGDRVGYDSTAVGIEQPGGTAANAEDLVYTYTGTANDNTTWSDTTAPTKAGSYTLTVCHRDAMHYTGTQSVSFTIERKPVEVPAQAEAVTYNGQEQTYAVTETEYYSVNGGIHTDANEAGYVVTISLKDSNNTCWTGGSLDDLTHGFVINKALVTVTAKNQSIYVGDTTPDLSSPQLNTHYTVTGLVGEDALSGTITMEYQKDGETATPNTGKIGTYDIVISGATVPNDTNYSDVTFTPGTLTISTRPGSGGYTPFQSVTVPISGDDNTIHVWASVSGDKATVKSVDLPYLNGVIGDHVDTGIVTIDFSELDEKITEVELPREMVEKIAEVAGESERTLKIVLSGGVSIEFNASVLSEQVQQIGGFTVSIIPHENAKLTHDQKTAVGDRPAYDISITSGGKNISNMGVEITITVPYELRDGEKGSGLVVYYVDDHGKRERCDTHYDAEAKRLSWQTDHLALYMLDYDEKQVEACDGEYCPINAFTDADNKAWYHNGAHYCLENDLMSGISNVLFAPNGTTTRAQIVTILWHLEGKPVVNYLMQFEDVTSAHWYSEAVRWAASENIVCGYGSGKFGPNDPITRQQMATILYRYCQCKGIDVSVGENVNILSYSDAFSISEWAIPAMQWACGSGMIQGIADGSGMKLDPSGSATRAQIATIFWRFCETIMDN